mgnify:CR=1 FL=1
MPSKNCILRLSAYRVTGKLREWHLPLRVARLGFLETARWKGKSVPMVLGPGLLLFAAKASTVKLVVKGERPFEQYQ